MNTKETIKHLRDGGSLNIWNTKTKLFTKIQLNRREKFICWQRYVSKDRRNWRKYNDCLSLKEVMNIRSAIAIQCQEMCFKTT